MTHIYIKSSSNQCSLPHAKRPPHERLRPNGFIAINFRIVGNSEANLKPLTFQFGYAASRISSILNGRTKQFGWLQASATKVSSLSITSTNPATIRICIEVCRSE